MHCCNLMQFPFKLVDRVVYNIAVINFRSCGDFTLSTPCHYGHTDHHDHTTYITLCKIRTGDFREMVMGDVSVSFNST